MNDSPLLTAYDATEEKLNVLTHGIGCIVACIASFALIVKSTGLPLAQWLSLWVYSASLILMLASSTLYHWAKTEQKRHWYKKLDHIAIYYLIAGTYTPFLMISIPTTKAHYSLIALWTIAAIGTVFKLGFAHRFGKVSLFAYLLMGWFAIIIMDDMQHYLPAICLKLIVWGGIAYSVGAIFYALKKLKYSHVIWHIFVLLGAAAHFAAVYLAV